MLNYKINDLASLLACEIKGDIGSGEISGLAPFFHAEENTVTFAEDDKFLKKLAETKAKYVIVPDVELPEIPGKVYLKVKENPRTLMPKIMAFFKKPIKKIEKMIEDSAKIGKNCQIGPNVYIGHDVVIGDNVTIYPNTTICQGVHIGADTLVYSNVTIREFCMIGARCVIQPGAVIGGDGFGFVKVDGNNVKIDQVGTVIIEDDVEIGANTTVDRGTIGDTIIRRYTKIDNLVQVAHNDIIGTNCILCGQVGLAGSSELGDNVTLAGQTGVGGHLKIGNNVMIGGRGGVAGNVPDNSIMSGLPLVPLKDDLKNKAAIKKLPEFIKKVKELEKELEELKNK